MQSWTDNQLENLYLNITKILADEKSSPETVGKARDKLKNLQEEWERRRQLAANSARSPDRPETGILKRLGYQVGNEGVKSTQRKIILEHIVEGILPFVPHPAYMDEWGEPGTEKRLEKLATTIAYLAQDKKRFKNDAYDKAIIEWEEDLDWLCKKYYKPKGYKFTWPKT